MKDTLGCGKCGSNKVVELKGSSMNQMTIVPYGAWKMGRVVIDRFICLKCGFTEEYAQLNAKFINWGEKQIEKRGGNFDGYV